ncbi:hypothetical protein L1987_38056 [Smallanthus sonchifolius]|uniref:Uncharacterized protein n=1 Tax=Smallanthus sonchifolius TaxID=185202 RepID=A0ACB9HHV5_9ASTR|nr:hypothetical protein L1987_38056 [Smallanthus sonchifolius]
MYEVRNQDESGNDVVEWFVCSDSQGFVVKQNGKKSPRSETLVHKLLHHCTKNKFSIQKKTKIEGEEAMSDERRGVDLYGWVNLFRVT